MHRSLKPPKCIISRDVTFNEAELVKMRQPVEEINSSTKSTYILEFEVEPYGHKGVEEAAESDNANIDLESSQKTHQKAQSKSCPQEQSYQLTRDRQKRIIRPPKRFSYADIITLALTTA